MKVLIDDSELQEILISDIVKSDDKAIVKIKGGNVGKRDEGVEDIRKEIIAHDAIIYGPAKAAEIHGVPQSSASKYKDGKDIDDEDTRARVLNERHNIADVAVSKLMDTLGLFNPENIEKESDKVRAAQSLATIVEKMTPSGKGEGTQIKLILYAPKSRAIEKYDVIDV